MDAEPRVRAAGPADTDAILDLVRRGLGEGRVPRTREFWTWKHLANPFGASYFLVAEADGAVVGLRAFLRWTWWSGRTPVSAVRAVDTVTDPAWRGRGLFRRLTLAMVDHARGEGAAFVYNTPNAASGRGYLRMGWERVGRQTVWLRPRIATGRRRAEAGTLPAARELLAEPGLDGLLARLGEEAGDRLRTRPEGPYLAWRYDPPGIPYAAAWSLGEDPAALVFRLVPRGRRLELRVCETLVPSTAGSVRRACRLVAESARAAGADLVTLFAPPGSAARRIALGGGFLPIPRLGPLLTVRRLAADGGPVDPRRRASWGPSIGALELF